MNVTESYFTEIIWKEKIGKIKVNTLSFVFYPSDGLLLYFISASNSFT